jgi:hypothetical protein
LYKKCGRHDIEAESINTDEEQFTTQFFNFVRKHQDIIISQVSVPQINLDISIGFTLSSAALLLITKSTMWMTSMNLALHTNLCQWQDVKDH